MSKFDFKDYVEKASNYASANYGTTIEIIKENDTTAKVRYTNEDMVTNGEVDITAMPISNGKWKVQFKKDGETVTTKAFPTNLVAFIEGEDEEDI